LSLTEDQDETLIKFRKEILDYHKEMYNFSSSEEDVADIMVKISAMSARVSWIRNLIVRSKLQYYQRFRIDEVDPFLSAVKDQFAIWSRYETVRRNEYDISRGQE